MNFLSIQEKGRKEYDAGDKKLFQKIQLIKDSKCLMYSSGVDFL